MQSIKVLTDFMFLSPSKRIFKDQIRLLRCYHHVYPRCVHDETLTPPLLYKFRRLRYIVFLHFKIVFAI